MRRSARALLVLLLLVTRPAFADDSADLFLRGSRELQAGHWEEAARLLEQAEGLRPSDPDVRALLGIAQYELGRLEECVASCRSALEGGTRYEARSLYTLGIALSRLGERDDAQRAFSRLLHDHPDSPEAARLRESASGRGGPRFRPWSLLVLGSAQHDDNPTRGPRVEDIDLTTTNLTILPPDWMGQLWLSGTRRFAGSRPVLHGTVFRMDYRDSNQLDFTFVETGVEGALVDSRRTRIVPAYAFRYSWLGGQAFEIRHAIDVAVTRALGASWASTLDLTVAHRSHPETIYEDLDGGDLSASMRLERRGAPGSRLRSWRVAGLLAESGAAQGYLKHSDASASAAASFALPARATLGISLEARQRSYRETDVDHPTRRQDFRWLGSASATLPLERSLQVSLRVTRSSNDSNLARYDYRQLVAGTTIAAAF